ncbi:hypothetical protein DL98DRAFT_553800 [Cadophora sp. DSE1049]|nr:hypothetical protein DL98DRAFT_553800 [Cadophora sp. DSE1049]
MVSSLLAIRILLLASPALSQNGGIDTHLHALPQAYIDAIAANGGDPSGFPTPSWSIDAAIASMDSLNTSIGILSVSTPGVPIAGTGKTARRLARTLNTELGRYSTDSRYKSRIGFFGVLPDWQDVDGTLAEIDFLYKEQKLCSGVTVYTTYGEKLLAYKTLVFLHPGVLDVKPKFIGNGIPQPIIDYPLATTRAAVDLVVTGTVRTCPDVDIILSHAGGTPPFLGSRAIVGLNIPVAASKSSVTSAQAVEDFGRVFLDIALSTSPAQLNGLLDFTKPEKVLFGSDFPYAPAPAIAGVVAGYANFVQGNARGGLIAPEVLRGNVLALLGKHAQGQKFS